MMYAGEWQSDYLKDRFVLRTSVIVYALLIVRESLYIEEDKLCLSRLLPERRSCLVVGGFHW